MISLLQQNGWVLFFSGPTVSSSSLESLVPVFRAQLTQPTPTHIIQPLCSGLLLHIALFHLSPVSSGNTQPHPVPSKDFCYFVSHMSPVGKCLLPRYQDPTHRDSQQPASLLQAGLARVYALNSIQLVSWALVVIRLLKTARGQNHYKVLGMVLKPLLILNPNPVSPSQEERHG